MVPRTVRLEYVYILVYINSLILHHILSKIDGTYYSTVTIIQWTTINSAWSWYVLLVTKVIFIG